MPTFKWLKNGNNYYYFGDAPVHASSIILNKSSISLNSVGQTEQLIATVSPNDAVEKKVHWSTSNLTVATVSQTGLVTCVTPGDCIITAECDGVSATCEVVNYVGEVLYLLVGGGGGGWNAGGGGGEVLEGCSLIKSTVSIIIGEGGGRGAYEDCKACDGGQTCFGTVVANGGCGGRYECGGTSGSGCPGGVVRSDTSNAGGGGAGAAGCDGGIGANAFYGGNGGAGIRGYGGGGGGGGCCINYSRGGKGQDGGGDGGSRGEAGTTTNYGGGGGGTYWSPHTQGGVGCQGMVEVCYKADGSCGFTTATGGDCCYTCDGYCVHRFTSDGTFTVVN